MKKVNFLLMSTFLLCTSVFSQEYWVIKDGVLNESIIQMEYALPEDDGPETFDLLTSGVEAPDGSIAASVKHNKTQWTDIRLDLREAPLDLSKTWIFEIEYMYTDLGKNRTELESDKRPLFIFSLIQDMNEGIDLPKGEAVFAVDGKFEVDENVWASKSLYVYTHPSVSNIDVMMISYCRDIDKEMNPAFIKNMKFIASSENCSKPFYAENFNTFKGKVPYYTSNSMSVANFTENQLVGNKQIKSTEKVEIRRDWQDNGTDNSGFYDNELFHALVVPKDAAPILIESIEIPTVNNGNIYASALFKRCWVEAEGDMYDEAIELEERLLNVKLVFDNGVESKLFTDSILEWNWRENESVIAIPAGATSVDVVFEPIGFSYYVNNLQLGTCERSTDIEDIEFITNELVVYPNPANDVVYIVGKVSKAEIISLTGSVVATSNTNNVNISYLSEGMYIVKVYTENGVRTSTIIKK